MGKHFSTNNEESEYREEHVIQVTCTLLQLYFYLTTSGFGKFRTKRLFDKPVVSAKQTK